MARIGEGMSSLTILIGKPIGRSPLGRPAHRWDYSIRMDLQEISISVRCFDLAQDKGLMESLCEYP